MLLCIFRQGEGGVGGAGQARERLHGVTTKTAESRATTGQKHTMANNKNDKESLASLTFPPPPMLSTHTLFAHLYKHTSSASSSSREALKILPWLRTFRGASACRGIP